MKIVADNVFSSLQAVSQVTHTRQSMAIADRVLIMAVASKSSYSDERER
jgi:hypothetical protein